MAMISTHVNAPKVFSTSNLVNLVSELILVRRQRTALKSLSLSQLCDMGVSSKQADAEARRPIWDVPVYWKQ